MLEFWRDLYLLNKYRRHGEKDMCRYVLETIQVTSDFSTVTMHVEQNNYCMLYLYYLFSFF